MLLGLAMLIAAGTAADLSANPLPYCAQSSSLSMKGSNREVGQWLTRLTRVAKEWHGQLAAIDAPRQPGVAFQFGRRIHSAFNSAVILRPLSQVCSHLIDLPPPVL